MAKWLNFRLLLGLTVIALTLIAGFEPKWLTAYGPYQVDAFHGWDSTAPPFPPSHLHFFGTDEKGLDVFARVLYGTLPTLLDATVMVAIVILVSFVLGVMRALYNVRIPLLDVLADMMTIVPTMLLGLLILEAPWVYFSPQLRWWYYFVIAGLEVARFVPTVEGDVRLVSQKPFIESAVMAGCSSFWIFRKHMLPWIRPYLMEYIPLQYARVLTVMGELAYFSVFTNVLIQRSEDGWVIETRQLDWASLIGMNSEHWFSVPTAVLFPTLAFCVLIFGLRLTSAGINRATQLERSHHWAWPEKPRRFAWVRFSRRRRAASAGIRAVR